MTDVLDRTADIKAPLRPRYLLLSALGFALMTAAIAGPSLWLLNFVHIAAGGLWTGIDLFMGFVIGPVLRGVSLDARKMMMAGLIPRTLVLMPTLSIITSTTGWFLTVRVGFMQVGFPEFWWVITALAIVTVLTIQGLGYLLPTNLKLYFELQKPAPDFAKLGGWMKTYMRVVAAQGVLQVSMLIVMSRFGTGF
jgi:hypothetical protein